MAFSGNYQQKWTRDNRGNLQTTVWLEERRDKNGNAYWCGSLSMNNSRRLGFIVNGKTIAVDRKGKSVNVTPIKVTVLPKIDAPSIGF